MNDQKALDKIFEEQKTIKEDNCFVVRCNAE